MTKVHIWAYGDVKVNAQDGGVELTAKYEQDYKNEPMFLTLSEAQAVVDALTKAISKGGHK